LSLIESDSVTLVDFDTLVADVFNVEHYRGSTLGWMIPRILCHQIAVNQSIRETLTEYLQDNPQIVKESENI
jgi:hypothetical protein